MRKPLLLSLILLLAGAGLAALIEQDPGYILVAYDALTVEMSIWTGLFLLIIGYALFHFALAVLRQLLATRSSLREWLSFRAHSREIVKLELRAAAGEYGKVVKALSGKGPDKLKAQELRLLVRARRGLADWRELADLLPWVRRRLVLDAAELEALEFDVWRGILQTAAGDELKQAWNQVPADQRKDARLIANYGAKLVEAGDDIEAEKLLTRAIERSWDGRLVALYGSIRGRDPARRLKRAETWLKAHPDDPSLMLCLGRLSLRNNLWGHARDYFEASHRLRPSSEACAELARLLFSLGEREKSAQLYREGLLLRETRLPDLPLPRRAQPREALAHS